MAWIIGINEVGVIAATCTECDETVVARTYEEVSNRIDEHICRGEKVLDKVQKEVDKVSKLKYTLW